MGSLPGGVWAVWPTPPIVLLRDSGVLRAQEPTCAELRRSCPARFLKCFWCEAKLMVHMVVTECACAIAMQLAVEPGAW